MRKERAGFFSDYYKDAENRKTLDGLLRTVLVIGMAVVPLMLFFRLWNEFVISDTDVIIFCLLPLFAVYYFLLRKGLTALVSMLFFSTVWIGLTLTASISAGIKDVSVIGYIILLFLSNIINGSGFSIILAILTLAALWVMAIAEEKGILIPYKDNPIEYARDFTVLVTLVLTAIILYGRSFKYTFRRINTELGVRKAAEAKLAENEKKLIVKNQELEIARKKAVEGERIKTSFIQNVTHEIRTPMNGIVGFAELLKDPALTEEKKLEYLNYITSCTKNLAEIINDIIDVSKIEAGDIDYSPELFRTGTLLESCIGKCREGAEMKNLVFEGKDNTGNIEVFSDFGKIVSVVTKIVCNAVKFTDAGTVSVSISRVASDLVISVADTGIGISREQTKHIFEKFRQADYSITRSHTGAGLGLSISKGIVDFMGGRITVESSPGKGSVFTVMIPVEFRQN
jgi:signal transduction histidine kinase